MAIPLSWLWDIIDEFLYQFQEFAQYSNKLKARSDSEIAELQASPDVCSSFAADGVACHEEQHGPPAVFVRSALQLPMHVL